MFRLQPPSRAEQPRDLRDGVAGDLVDGLHELEAVLQQEQEHREENQQRDDLADRRHGLAAVHALADLDELHREDEAQDAAADGQDGVFPHAADDVVHGDGAGAPQHLREVGRECALRADGREHLHLALEDPVADAAQGVVQAGVDVVGDGGERGLGLEKRREQDRDGGERHKEAPPLRLASGDVGAGLGHGRGLLLEHGELAVLEGDGEDGLRGVVQMEGCAHGV